MRMIALALALAAASGAQAGTRYVHAGRLIDTEHGKVLADQRIDITDDRVTAVGPWSPPPTGASVTDWSALTVLPGLIDCHTHFLDGYADSSDPAEALHHSAAATILKGARRARETLDAGFTTIRDVGVFRGLSDVALRDAIAAGDVTGPRMIVAGAYITIPNGGGAVTGAAPDVPVPADMRLGYVRNADDARNAVDMLFSRGADFIKMIATGAVLAVGSTPGALELTPEEMKAACDAAKRHGSYCIAHAHGAEGVKAAIRAGADAELLLDRGIDEDARHRGIERGAADELELAARPVGGVDDARLLVDHLLGDHGLALVIAERLLRHRREPDIDIEADLVAGMAGQRRTAARLAHVANEQSRPAIQPLGVAGEPLGEAHQLWRAPVAVAREAHRLPVGTVHRQRHRAGEAALGIGTDRTGLHRDRRVDLAEQHLGRRRVETIGAEGESGRERQQRRGEKRCGKPAEASPRSGRDARRSGRSGSHAGASSFIQLRAFWPAFVKDLSANCGQARAGRRQDLAEESSRARSGRLFQRRR